MESAANPKIVGVDRLADSLVISFSDGRSGDYSPELLYATLASANELFLPTEPDEEAEISEQ